MCYSSTKVGKISIGWAALSCQALIHLALFNPNKNEVESSSSLYKWENQGLTSWPLVKTIFLHLSTTDIWGLVILCCGWRGRDYFVYDRMFTSTLASTHWMPVAPPSCKRNISRHCQMSLKVKNHPQLRTTKLKWRSQHFHSMDNGHMPNSIQDELGTTEGLCPQELTLSSGLLAQLVFSTLLGLSPTQLTPPTSQ